MVWGLGELPYRSPYPRSTYSTEGEALGLLKRMLKIASPSAFSYIHPKRVLSGPRRRVQPPGRIGTIPGAPDMSIKQRTRSNRWILPAKTSSHVRDLKAISIEARNSQTGGDRFEIACF